MDDDDDYDETKLSNYMDNEFAEAEDKTATFGDSRQSMNQEEAQNKQNKPFDFFGKIFTQPKNKEEIETNEDQQKVDEQAEFEERKLQLIDTYIVSFAKRLDWALKSLDS